MSCFCVVPSVVWFVPLTTDMRFRSHSLSLFLCLAKSWPRSPLLLCRWNLFCSSFGAISSRYVEHRALSCVQYDIFFMRLILAIEFLIWCISFVELPLVLCISLVLLFSLLPRTVSFLCHRSHLFPDRTLASLLIAYSVRRCLAPMCTKIVLGEIFLTFASHVVWLFGYFRLCEPTKSAAMYKRAYSPSLISFFLQ